MTYTPNSEHQPPMLEPPVCQPQMVVTPWGLPFYVSGNEAHDRKMYFEQIRREMHKYITKFNELYHEYQKFGFTIEAVQPNGALERDIKITIGTDIYELWYDTRLDFSTANHLVGKFEQLVPILSKFDKFITTLMDNGIKTDFPYKLRLSQYDTNVAIDFVILTEDHKIEVKVDFNNESASINKITLHTNLASHTWRHRLNVPNTTSRLTFYGHRDIRNDLYMDDERVFEHSESDTQTLEFVRQFLNTIETLNVQR